MINENGELFTYFYHSNSLVIGVFPHKKIHKTTWISPDHQTENHIDHIYISRTIRRSVQDVFSTRGADVGTYHNLVTEQIKFKLKRYHPTAAKPGFRYNTELLRNIKPKYSFQLELANRYQLLSNLIAADATVEQVWQQSKSAWKETCDKILGKRTRQHKDWISAETLGKVAERKQRKATVKNSLTREDKTEAHRLYTDANKEVKHDKKDFVERLAGQTEEAAGQRNLKELYDITGKLAGTRRKDEYVMDKTGHVLTNQSNQLNRWKEYFEELLSRPSPDEPQDIPPTETPLRVNTDRPSKQEIRKALQERQSERLQRLEWYHVTVNASVQQDSSGKNENSG